MTPGARLLALDVLRGAAVAGMIVVNNPGHWPTAPPSLQHAAWNGWTFADLVFPFFIAIMGASIGLAFDRRPSAPAGRSAVHRRILRRTSALIAIGLLLNLLAAWPHPEMVRIPGVLQRIGITYAVTALIVLHGSIGRRIAIGAVLLVGQWVVLTLVPFGGSDAGVVTPDENLGRWLDQLVFGRHVLSQATDPEGLIGIPTSIATALGGSVAVGRLRTGRASVPAALGLVAGGVAVSAVGLAWSLVWAINKTLWTGSYALFALGAAVCALAILHLILDVPGVSTWSRPFERLGRNALAVYVVSEVVGRLIDRPFPGSHTSVKEIVFWRWLVPVIRDDGGAASSTTFAIAYASVWVIGAWFLGRTTPSASAPRAAPTGSGRTRAAGPPS